MTERPILFSGPMVRALLDGRKTQTRRVVKPMRTQDFLTPELLGQAPSARVVERWAAFEHPKGGPLTSIRCPYGVPGDSLYVRETVACGACAPGRPSEWSPAFWRREQGSPANPNGLWYAADGLSPVTPITERGRWVPGIHMPRWASRLTLDITDVRVQRLHDISDTDAEAEGVREPSLPPIHMVSPEACGEVDRRKAPAMLLWQLLWSGINGPDSWAANPWVWAVTFQVRERA